MIYLMPLTVIGNFRCPKYFQWKTNPGLNVAWSCRDFGVQNLCMVSASLTAQQSTTLLANADVVGIPEDGSKVGVALAPLQSMLTQYGMPMAWATIGMTWDQVIAALNALTDICQLAHGISNQSFLNATPSAGLAQALAQRGIATSDQTVNGMLSAVVATVQTQPVVVNGPTSN